MTHSAHARPAEAALSRRQMLLTTASAGALVLMTRAGQALAQQTAPVATAFDFKELPAGLDDKLHVAEGYETQVLVRWGDPVVAGAPAFDPKAQSAEKQQLQFGHNNDYLCFIPLPGSPTPGKHGLLCVNHEYSNSELMFPGVNAKTINEFRGKTTIEMARVEMAAIGGSIVEIRQTDGRWQLVPNSTYNRRLHVGTSFAMTGTAAGHPRLRTGEDKEGRTAKGMLGCCAGGMTPWGTWLAGEENIQQFFWGKLPASHREAENHKRYGSNGRFSWGLFDPRFNVEKEPTEMNRFGWVTEVDPLSPGSTPRKHTALGRFKHESATVIVNKDGRVVVYSGDDERYEFVYRFISKGRFDPANRSANLDLLTEGDLSVARYNKDGSLDWLPLVHGQGPLTAAANGFESQADVLIDARYAARLIGATPLDRPEDIEVSPKTGKIYVTLTYNERRKASEVDAANPRETNRFGHILEMIPPDGDHTAARFGWTILLLCGDPAKPEHGATFHPATSKDGWFGMPDNMAFDGRGRLWVGTDGNEPEKTGRGDGIWGVETEGPLRGYSKHFLRVPAGAECTGPFFTPDDETLFVSVQHPGEDGPSYPAHGRFSSADDPSTRWPDFKADMPPRPAVVAVVRKGGGKL
jgi:secreted PhoX family phosphatase